MARISYLKGAVSFQAAGTETWSRAELNRPAVEGDALWTDVAAGAELHLGSAAIRMDARTALDFLRFDDRIVQLRVTQGVIGVTVRHVSPGEILEIDTPGAAVTFSQAGQYRIEIQPDMETTIVTARSGDTEVATTRLSFVVHAGQRVNVVGTDAGEYGLAKAFAPDKFDEFCQARDRREDGCVASLYVSPDAIGAYDLDEFGEWRMDAQWGNVWTPRRLPEGWAPYRFGHWAWVEGWGWTWIDDAAWGFAPFHYGRWAFLDGAWSWVPGPPNDRAIYAPALAVFVGGGRRGYRYFYWIGTPGIAWFPLGPGRGLRSSLSLQPGLPHEHQYLEYSDERPDGDTRDRCGAPNLRQSCGQRRGDSRTTRGFCAGPVYRIGQHSDCSAPGIERCDQWHNASGRSAGSELVSAQGSLCTAAAADKSKLIRWSDAGIFRLGQLRFAADSRSWTLIRDARWNRVSWRHCAAPPTNCHDRKCVPHE